MENSVASSAAALPLPDTTAVGNLRDSGGSPVKQDTDDYPLVYLLYVFLMFAVLAAGLGVIALIMCK